MAASLPADLPPGYLEADTSSEIVRTAVAFIVLDTVATVLRACARHLQKTSFMWSDVFVPVSLLFNLGVCTSALLGVRWGAGKHAAAVPPADLIPFTILNYYGLAPVYLCSVTFSKLAILDLYLHIFTDKFSRYTTYAVGLVIVSSLLANFVAVLDQCHPITFLWDPTPDGWCHDIHAHFTWSSFPNIFTDLIMLLLPIPMILRLQATWRVKTGILITFLVGSLGLVTSILRFIEFYNFGWNNGFSDPTWVDSIILIWTVVEPSVYHLAACFVTLRPLFRWIIFDSPLSSALSRSRLLSGSRHSTNATIRTPKKFSSSASGGSIDGRSDRNYLVNQTNGFNQPFARPNNSSRHDDDLELNIQVKRGFEVSKDPI